MEKTIRALVSLYKTIPFVKIKQYLLPKTKTNMFNYLYLLPVLFSVGMSDKNTYQKLATQFVTGPESTSYKILSLYVPHRLPPYNQSDEQDVILGVRTLILSLGFNLSRYNRSGVYVGPGTEHYTGAPLFLDGNYWENNSFFMSKNPQENPTLLSLTITNIDSETNNLCPCRKDYVCIQPEPSLPPFCTPEISENKLVDDVILQVNILVIVIVCGLLFYVYSY